MSTAITDPTTCEHGLSLDLCAGPNHYPADDQFLYEDDVSERFAGERIPADWDDGPGDDELLFMPEYGVVILSSDFCSAPSGWHSPNCPNQPPSPF